MPLIDTGVNPVTGLSGIAHAKALKLAEINEGCENTMSQITATYPQSEMLTFDKQEQEARAYVLDNSVSTPLLSALAASRGIELAELVSRVITKADLFAALSGAVIGQRQAMEDLLDLADTIESVNAITVTYSLPGV